MKMQTMLKEVGLGIIFSFLVYFNAVYLKNALAGWLILFAFLLTNSRQFNFFLVRSFGFSQTIGTKVLSIFLSLSILGFVFGASVWFYKVTPIILSISFLVTWVIGLFFKVSTNQVVDFRTEDKSGSEKINIIEFSSAQVGVLLYLTLIFFGFYFLFISQTGKSVFSPWQTISPYYIYVFFGATVMIGFLIFSKLKTGPLLFLLVLYSLLLHAYLPLTHSLFYGADGWRHLAIENNMLIDSVQRNLNFDVTPSGFWQRFNFGGLAYAQFNSLAVLFRVLCQMDFLVYLRYFLPLVWSIIFPIIVFEIALAFGWEKKRSLFLVWMSALPFALQVSGSFTLPSNLSFLIWLLVLLFQVKKNETEGLYQNLLIIFLGVMMLFGHSLYFILFCLSFILFKIIKLNNTFIKNLPFKILIGTVFSVMVIPVIEIMTKFSQFKQELNWWMQIKTLLKSFGGWFVSAGLRSSDITAGNIIFNQPPLNNLTSNFFIDNRGWIVGFMCLFWISFVLGWYKILIKKFTVNNLMWLMSTAGLTGGYIISRYFLTGENIFSRRMDAVLAILIIFSVAHWFFDLPKITKNIYYQKLVLFFVVVIFSLAISTSYALGPDGETASIDQYRSATYIWEKEKNNPNKVCVLADFYTSVELEGLSGKKIVGGGFPMNLYFNQPQRDQLWQIAQTEPQKALFEAKKLLNTESCYLVGGFNLPDSLVQFGQVKIFKN